MPSITLNIPMFELEDSWHKETITQPLGVSWQKISISNYALWVWGGRKIKEMMPFTGDNALIFSL